jgi:Tfp pilus assembly pilus retraction ATPase PilT
LIDSVIQTSKDVGMIALDASLAKLVQDGTITMNDAVGYASHVEELQRQVGQ